MSATGAGKGSRPRKVDLKKYGTHFDAIFSRGKKDLAKASSNNVNSVLMGN